jgi:hypothetical protein
MQITFFVEAGHRLYFNDSLFLFVQSTVNPNGTGNQTN